MLGREGIRKRGKAMVDLKELGMFENDIVIATSRKPPDIKEFERIVNEQQIYIRSLVKENEKLREHILDGIIY